MQKIIYFLVAVFIALMPFISTAASANDQEIKGLLQNISALVSEIDGLLAYINQSGAYAGIVAGATTGTSLSETIIDNTSSQTKKFGTWCKSVSSGFYGVDSLYSCGSGADIFSWIPSFQESAKYEVFMWWTSHPNRSTAGLVQIEEESGADATQKRVNQQIDGGKWNSLGIYTFGPGTGTRADGGSVKISDQYGQVAADAVKFVKMESTQVAFKYSNLPIPTNTLVNGTNIIYRFAVKSSTGDGTINNPTFNVQISGADAFDPVMYVYADSAFSLSAHSGPIPGVFRDKGLVEFNSPNLINIPGGSTRYFEVRLGVANKTAGATVSSYPVFIALPTETLSSGGTIVPSITVISPNGGETWPVGSTQKISWTSSNIPSSNLLSIGARNTSTGVDYSLVGDTLNSGAVIITVPSTLSAGTYLLFIKTLVGGSIVNDWGDTPFSIVSSVLKQLYTRLSIPTNTLSNGTLTLYRFSAFAPKGGGDIKISSFNVGTSKSGAVLSDLGLYAYADSGFSMQAYASNPVGTQSGTISTEIVDMNVGSAGAPIVIPDGATRYFELRGTVSVIASSAYLNVSVEGLTAQTLSSSGGTIVPSITVLSPNGGETWQRGQTVVIKWNSTNAPTAMVDLVRPGYEYHLTGPTGDIVNTGSLQYVVPVDMQVASDYRIRVMHRVNAVPVAEDLSDAPFGIKAELPLPLNEIIVDDGNPGTSRTGSWCLSGASGFYGKGSLYSCGLSTLETYRWSPSLPGTAYDSYEISMWWTQHANRSTNVPVKILANIGGVQIPSTVYVNQQMDGGKWNSLGTFLMGDGSYVEVSDKNGQAAADAVKFAKKSTATSGMLTVSLDPSAPSAPRYGIGGTTDQVLTVLRWHATTEPIRLDKLGLTLSKSALPTDFVKVTIWDGGTKVGEAVFAGGASQAIATLFGDFIIPKDGDKLMTIKVDLSRVGTAQPGKVGNLIQIGYSGALSAQTRGIGQTSGTYVYSSTPWDVSGSEIILVRSFPTLERLPVPSNTLTNGTMTLYRFKVTASSAEDVGLGKVSFTISSPSPKTSALQLYGYSDSGFSVQAYARNPLNSPTALHQAGGLVEIYFNSISYTDGVKEAIQIPAGTIRYFELRSIVSEVVTGSALSVSLQGDGAMVPIGSLAFVDVASEDDFIWSGNSTTTSGVYNNDWLNGYSLPGLPSGGMVPQVFSK